MNKRFTIVMACLLPLVLAACMSPLTPQPTATLTRLPTLIPTSTRTPMPTVGATETSTPKPVSHWSSQSPDGKWIVQGTMEGPFADSAGGNEMYHTRLDVIRADETVTWTVWDQTSPYGLGYTTPRPFYWTRDGHFFYFTNEPVPDGCAIFINGSDLYRLDLTNGHVAQIVSPSAWWLSISPDEKKVAYIY